MPQRKQNASLFSFSHYSTVSRSRLWDPALIFSFLSPPPSPIQFSQMFYLDSQYLGCQCYLYFGSTLLHPVYSFMSLEFHHVIYSTTSSTEVFEHRLLYFTWNSRILRNQCIWCIEKIELMFINIFVPLKKSLGLVIQHYTYFIWRHFFFK